MAALAPRLMYFCSIALLFGVGIPQFIKGNILFLGAVFLICGCCWIFFYKIYIRKPFLLCVVVLFFLSIGMIRGVFDVLFSGSYHVIPEGILLFSGEIDQDPLVKNGRQGFTVTLHEPNNYRGEKVFVWASLYPSLYQWDRVRGSCTIRPNISQSRNHQECSYAIISKIAADNSGFFTQFSAFRKKITIRIEEYLPQPHAGLLSSILFGARNELSRSVRDAFRAVGLTHIIAISGYNIAIVVAILSTMLLSCGVHRKQLPIVLGIGIALFTVFVGSSAATVRAAIMGFLVACSHAFGRRADGILLLFVSASLMVIIHPSIINNVGFQLSFLATGGLVVMAPLFEAWKPKFFPSGIYAIVSQTLSATIFTTPLILATFGTFSFSSLIANLLVIPVIPFVMIFGLFYSLYLMLPFNFLYGLGEAGAALGAWLLWLALEYSMVVAHTLSLLPFSFLHLAWGIGGWIAAGILYACIAYFVIFFHQRTVLLSRVDLYETK